MDVQVLVDWQNLFKTCENRFPIDRVVEEIIGMAEENGLITEIRLFVPNYQNMPWAWKLLNYLQLKYGVAIEVCPVLREGPEGEKESWKDLVDLSFYRWVAKHFSVYQKSKLVIFVSGDGHFVVAGNETRRRVKKVEFWIVDPQATSEAIFKVFQVREIKIRETSVLNTEENPFITALKNWKDGALTPTDRQRLDLLKKVLGLIPIIGIGVEQTQLNQEIQKRLEVPAEDVRNALQALIATGVMRIHPVIRQAASIDSSSSLFQWLTTIWK